VYLSVGSSLLRSFSDTNLSPRERANLAWKPVIFLRLWKTWVFYEKYNPNTHFISDQTYTDTILARHSVILNMLIFAKYFPDVPFCPWFLGSDSCEVLFSYLRGFTKGKNNFNFMEMLDITVRTIRLLELKHKNRRQEIPKQKTAWPSNLASEVIEGMKDAEREMLKTMEEMEMIPGLRAANVVYKNQRTGELTILNSPTNAFVSEKTAFPDEAYIAPFEELYDLDNNILLNSLEQEDPTRLELAGIIAQTSSEDDPENVLDEGGPENCQLFKRGICKFQEKGFVEPRTVHWIGCEFPDCGKWWHEIFLGIKFKTDDERNHYSFVCHDHECDIAELYPQREKLKATKDNKSILEKNELSVQNTQENSEKRRRQQKYRELRPEQYVEYNGQVYHIANFLSLQIGKTYVPTTGRLSRWLSSSRCDFYDSIESSLNTDKATLTLGNFAADYLFQMWD